MDTLIKKYIDFDQALVILDPHLALYLFGMLFILYFGKKIHDLMTSYNLNEELVGVDNKAVAVSFAGYILALTIIMSGILSGESTVTPSENVNRDIFFDLLNTCIWSMLGIILLQIGRIINDKILLNKFCNSKELTIDRNVGTGAVEFGTFVGTGLIIRAALTGEEEVRLLISIVSTLFYFFAGQIAFIIFGKLYQYISRYNLHDEIEKDNISAGVSFGLSLIAIAILLSGYVSKYESLIGLSMWFVISVTVLLACRYIVDKTILPGHLLDEEISQDQNWGAALVEGASAIGIALFCIAVI